MSPYALTAPSSFSPSFSFSPPPPYPPPYPPQVKTIPGGSMSECAYVDGVVFRKHVVHKRMERSVASPRVLLLAGGIEFQRSSGWGVRLQRALRPCAVRPCTSRPCARFALVLVFTVASPRPTSN